MWATSLSRRTVGPAPRSATRPPLRVAEIGTFSSVWMFTAWCSGYCTPMMYGLPVDGSIQKFGASCALDINVITALMSSAQLAPNFWIEPSTGNPYIIGVQYPEHQAVNIQTLENVPISATRSGGRVAERGAGPTVRLLKDVAHIERTEGPVEIYHNESTRVSQLFVSLSGNDLGRASAEIERICAEQELPKGIR